MVTPLCLLDKEHEKQNCSARGQLPKAFDSMMFKVVNNNTSITMNKSLQDHHSSGKRNLANPLVEKKKRGMW
jgi:hypothetical protein